METRRLGRTDLEVSAIALGTMTWGQQNDETDAFRQLDYALERGVTFIDTAEMYPVPPRAETVHRTEEHIGRWIAERRNRDRYVLATKVTGRAPMRWIRNGPRLSREHIHQAVEGSLRRLQTDYIDVYQVHWPERKTNFFGRLGYQHRPDSRAVPIEETLEALNELVMAGKVRHIGLSNETPWGVMRYCELAAEHGWARPVSIQNPYSLLNRSFEVGLAEMAVREDVGLLAYSPLAFGVLSGKYLDGNQPQGARLTEFGDHFTRYVSPRAVDATRRYVRIAREAGLDAAQMALAYVTSRPFVTSNIIGATNMDQLRSNLGSADVTLPKDVLEAIDEVHTDNPNPAP